MCTDLFFMSSFPFVSFSGFLWEGLDFRRPWLHSVSFTSSPRLLLHLWASSRCCKYLQSFPRSLQGKTPSTVQQQQNGAVQGASAFVILSCLQIGQSFLSPLSALLARFCCVLVLSSSILLLLCKLLLLHPSMPLSFLSAQRKSGFLDQKQHDVQL